jgi:hypothetical protein
VEVALEDQQRNVDANRTWNPPAPEWAEVAPGLLNLSHPEHRRLHNRVIAHCIGCVKARNETKGKILDEGSPMAYGPRWQYPIHPGHSHVAVQPDELNAHAEGSEWSRTFSYRRDPASGRFDYAVDGWLFELLLDQNLPPHTPDQIFPAVVDARTPVPQMLRCPLSRHFTQSDLREGGTPQDPELVQARSAGQATFLRPCAHYLNRPGKMLLCSSPDCLTCGWHEECLSGMMLLALKPPQDEMYMWRGDANTQHVATIIAGVRSGRFHLRCCRAGVTPHRRDPAAPPGLGGFLWRILLPPDPQPDMLQFSTWFALYKGHETEEDRYDSGDGCR